MNTEKQGGENVAQEYGRRGGKTDKMNINKLEIEQTIRRIKIRFQYKLNIDWTSGRPRIMREDNGRYLSPRGTKREILTWLSGFEEGLDEMERLNRITLQG